MRAAHLILVAIILSPLLPVAEATWTTSVNVPTSFRPERTVTFSYTASSSSGADLPVRWRIWLYTCQDLDGDAWCETSDAHRVDHGAQQITPLGGASQTASWSVSLATPEGSYRYHFHVTCLDNPCTGQPPSPVNNRTGAFQLAYTSTWTRQIVTTNPTSVGSQQAVTYRLASTSPDDPDLKGAARLFSHPSESPETDLGAKDYEAFANTIQSVQWSGVAFPDIGTHGLRVEDTTAADTFLTVTVRGVHLHVTQPRATYQEGARASLYLTLEGHGSTPDPAPIANQDIQLTVKNGTHTIATWPVRTDASGCAYANITAPNDAVVLSWTAATSGSWLGLAYSLARTGEIAFTPPSVGDHSAIEENVTAIRENLSDVQLRGVHLDEVGSRNVWMTSLRAAGAVALAILLVLLVVFIAFRV